MVSIILGSVLAGMDRAQKYLNLEIFMKHEDDIDVN